MPEKTRKNIKPKGEILYSHPILVVLILILTATVLTTCISGIIGFEQTRRAVKNYQKGDKKIYVQSEDPLRHTLSITNTASDIDASFVNQSQCINKDCESKNMAVNIFEGYPKSLGNNWYQIESSGFNIEIYSEEILDPNQLILCTSISTPQDGDEVKCEIKE